MCTDVISANGSVNDNAEIGFTDHVYHASNTFVMFAYL